MTRVIVTLVVVTGALTGGCDIIYHNSPVTAAEHTGLFKGITTSDETNDQSCSSFLTDNPPSFQFDFENFDKTGPGFDVNFGASAPTAANTLSAQQVQLSITNPDDSECPFFTLGEIAFEFAPPAPAPDASGQSNEDFTPVIIHNAIVAASTPCASPATCPSTCMDPIEESRLVDVRMFCFAQ